MVIRREREKSSRKTVTRDRRLVERPESAAHLPSNTGIALSFALPEPGIGGHPPPLIAQVCDNKGDRESALRKFVTINDLKWRFGTARNALEFASN